MMNKLFIISKVILALLVLCIDILSRIVFIGLQALAIVAGILFIVLWVM